MSEHQGTLFDLSDEPGPGAYGRRRLGVPYSNPTTSKATAESVKPDTNRQRARVRAYLIHRGKDGATDEEMQAHIPMNASTQRPRRVELVTAGEVVDSGRKRPTASGHPAIVWACTEFLKEGEA